jgi:hypothetical protein
MICRPRLIECFSKARRKFSNSLVTLTVCWLSCYLGLMAFPASPKFSHRRVNFRTRRFRYCSSFSKLVFLKSDFKNSLADFALLLLASVQADQPSHFQSRCSRKTISTNSLVTASFACVFRPKELHFMASRGQHRKCSISFAQTNNTKV